MWQDPKLVVIKELICHQAQCKAAEEMLFFEKIKPKTENIKGLNSSNCIAYKFTSF